MGIDGRASVNGGAPVQVRVLLGVAGRGGLISALLWSRIRTSLPAPPDAADDGWGRPSRPSGRPRHPRWSWGPGIGPVSWFPLGFQRVHAWGYNVADALRFRRVALYSANCHMEECYDYEPKLVAESTEPEGSSPKLSPVGPDGQGFQLRRGVQER